MALGPLPPLALLAVPIAVAPSVETGDAGAAPQPTRLIMHTTTTSMDAPKTSQRVLVAVPLPERPGIGPAADMGSERPPLRKPPGPRMLSLGPGVSLQMSRRRLRRRQLCAAYRPAATKDNGKDNEDDERLIDGVPLSCAL